MAMMPSPQAFCAATTSFSVMQLAPCSTGADDLVPMMVLTADTSIEAKRRALALGARDIVTKPFDVFEFGLRVANLIELRLLFEQRARG